VPEHTFFELMSEAEQPTTFANDRGVIHRYRKYLPVTDNTPVVSLSEGSTPLIHVPRLSARVGKGCTVLVKFEGLNPTGSFKDRGMTMAMSKAREKGSKAVICASTGNTSAAAAAYATRASMDCVVLLPAGKISQGKLAQAFVYGAKVVAIDGNFDRALELVREIGERDEFEIVNSINPYRIEGQKTASFEIIDDLGDAPHVHVLPVGNAGNITAYWKGYREYHAEGKSTRLPKMMGFQAAGSAPIFYNKIVTAPETVATAIRIGNPASWDLANEALSTSGGKIDIVTDAEILEAQGWLAANEGIFVEPASAASIAGLLKCCKMPRDGCPIQNIEPESTIVCTVTGHGLKDIDTALSTSTFRTIDSAAESTEILRKLGY
jgi:threonine synthase